MKRVLSGIQPSGTLHIGNYFGMMKPMIEYQETSDLFAFIVNYHALTTVHDAELLKKSTDEALIDFVSLGLDPDKCTLWVQSDIPEVQELTWILSCVTPMGLLERAHSYKDKTAKGIAPSHGLFAYPVLMTSDILIMNADVVPVGKDQKQHVEMARDIAEKFNHIYGETFTLPEPEIPEEVGAVPGTDGQKMSKSYGNTIPIFGEEADIKKIVMGVVTDSKAVEEPKEETSVVYQLYKLFAPNDEFGKNFLAGGVGYGDMKKKLFEVIWEFFKDARERREELLKNPDLIEEIRKKGAAKARLIAMRMVEDVRNKVGL
jgi:tryptophanyl-tRNA synthetase